ncbi:hypothetical protein AGMMS50230_00130 [Spirochaetia bacterium]|nr:hypothetical protein AGMMS50230_00130 [Spirochaetia bacterium]
MSACTARREPAFYISLRNYPVYIKSGFNPQDTKFDGFLEKEPRVLGARLSKLGWKIIETGKTGIKPVIIKDLDLDKEIPGRIFLSPFGEKDREYTIVLRFVMDGKTMEKIQSDTRLMPGMYFASLGDNWAVYLNGNAVKSEMFLDSEGQIKSHRSWRQIHFPVDKLFLREGINTVTLHIVGPPNYASTGMFYTTPYYIAPYEYITRTHDETVIIALCAIYLFVGLYYFLIFINHRGSWHNLYYSCFSALLGIYSIARSSWIYSFIPDSNILAKIEYGTIFMAIPVLIAFVEHLSIQRMRLFTRMYTSVCIFFTLSCFIFSPEYGGDILTVWQVSTLLVITVFFGYDVLYIFFSLGYRDWKQLKKRPKKKSLWRYYLAELIHNPLGNILLSLTFLFAASLADILDSLFFHHGFAVSRYGFFIFTLSSALILNSKFTYLYQQLNQLNDALEESNTNLEETVRRRTGELEEQTRLAEFASRAKSEFLAQMSHEIRTPMNAILGMVELMLHKDIPDTVYENAVSVKHAGDNLLSIINDVLDFSKIESGKLEIVSTEYALSSLLNDCINIVKMRFSQKNLLFVVDADGKLPDKLMGDENRIRQILLNLLTNAFKYTPEGHVRFTVSGVVSAGDENGIILSFAVHDTGIGIKDEDRDKLFDSFARLDLKVNQQIEGTGLGLAITRNLCRLMGGDITVESIYGSGSTFTVRIPQTLRDKVPLAEVTDPRAKPVLICDNRPLIADSVRFSLESMDVPVTVADHIERFFEELKKGQYAFALCPSCFAVQTADFIKEKNLLVKSAVLAARGEIISLQNIPLIAMPAYVIPLADMLNGKSSADSQRKKRISFSAPGVQVLIVDDIITNLKVTKGLLSLYQMDVDTCTSGEEALRQVRKKTYDLILMDHMMPGMDGIEAARKIRSMGGTYSTVPIIALTANAVSGTREMFLSHGFNDYLAKPMELSKLANMAAKWIPREKQVRELPEFSAGPLAASTPSTPALPSFGVIEEINVEQGLIMAGGSMEAYREIAAAFLEDCEEKQKTLTKPEEDIRSFTVAAHGIKSGAAAIGAQGLSKKAAALEAAGKAGDLETIGQELPAFLEDMKIMTNKIHAILEAVEYTI